MYAQITEDLAGPRELLGQRALHRLGQHEVAELRDLVALADHDVLRRQIAMDDLIVVCVFQSAGEVGGDAEAVPPVEHPGHSDTLDHLR